MRKVIGIGETVLDIIFKGGKPISKILSNLPERTSAEEAEAKMMSPKVISS